MKFYKKPENVDMTIFEMARPKKVDPTAPAGDEDGTSYQVAPEFKPSGAAMKQTIKLFEAIFDNMKNKRDFKQFAGVLLTGNPGTGKTTRINLLSKILGINLITVEAPHIVEEHIINIPFIVFNPENDSKKAGSTKLTGDEYTVVLADSNLYSQLKATSKVSDEQHLKNIYRSSRDVIELFEALGGSKDELPPEIKEIRDTYSVILFLDEYFRQTSVRIRNMLRGILNGKIGAHQIPKNAYIIYATNLEDQGIDEIPQNTQFQQVELKNPSKKEWFSWLTYKFEKDEHVKLNKAIINKFHHILEDEDISHEDPDNAVRTSPRRWEQLLLYINAGLPAKDEQDAVSLMTNIKTNFRDYLEGTHSKLAKKVLKATAELIKETSGIEISHHAANGASEWRATLKHQLEQKQKLGEHRKYVPIISGLPGIGKTAQAEHLAAEMDLRFIDIDVSTINAEDVVGLPIPKTSSEGQLETTFSIPSLYHLIMDKIKDDDKAYLEKLKKQHPDDFETYKEEYKKRPYKYLIFFDELNRNSPKVFNAIRRVLLEKNFGPSGDGKGKLLELPKEAIVLGAINPHDTGAQELTSHMKDVLDIIESASSWDHTLSYLKDEKQKLPGVEDSVHDVSLDIVKKFAHKFETKDSKVPMKERPFHLDLGQDIYVSPREYTMIYIALVRALHRSLQKIKKLDLSSMTANEIADLEDGIREDMFDSLQINVGFIFTKQGPETDEFFNDLKNWILHSPDIDFGENLFYRKSFDTKANSLMDIVGEHFDGAVETSASENSSFINFMNNVDLAKFREDLTDLAADRIVDEASAKKYILDDKYPQKTMKDGKIVTSGDKVSLVENFMREIVYALYINEMANDKIQAVAKGVYEALRQYKTKNEDVVSGDLMDEIIMKLVQIRMTIVDVIDDELK